MTTYPIYICHCSFCMQRRVPPGINFEYLPDPNVEAVRSKLLARSRLGHAKYGCDTTRSDLDAAAWLRHLQEELMDAAVYIERLLNEARQTASEPKGL